MPKSVNLKRAINTYLFTSQPLLPPFNIRPYRWAVSIHSGTAPLLVSVDSTYFTDPAKVKSVKYVSSWSAINGELADGVQNAVNVEFDHVPLGETWTITYYITWGIQNNGGVDNPVPLLVTPLASERVVSQSTVLAIPINNLRLIDQ